MPLTPAEQLTDDKIHSQNLHIRFDEQLVEMAKSHADMIPQAEEDLDKILNFPDAVRWELKKRDFPADELEAEIISKRDYYQWNKDKLEEIVSLIASEQRFRKNKKVTRTPRN